MFLRVWADVPPPWFLFTPPGGALWALKVPVGPTLPTSKTWPFPYVPAPLIRGASDISGRELHGCRHLQQGAPLRCAGPQTDFTFINHSLEVYTPP